MNHRIARPSDLLRVALVSGVAAIAGAEALVASGRVVEGALCHAAIALALLNGSAFSGEAMPRRAFASLAPISLLRILSLAVPIARVPQFYWYAMVGLPLLAAAALLAWRAGLRCECLRVDRRGLPTQVLIALAGLPLGLAAFVILRPKPLVATPQWPAMLAGAAILVAFAGFVEELLFRGLVQQVAVEVYGSLGLIVGSVLFASVYAGSLSYVFVLYAGCVGLLFGLLVKRTGSIWGVVAAHGILNVGSMLVWPLLLR